LNSLPTVQPFPFVAWISLVHAFGTLLLGGSLLSGTGAAVLACGIRGLRERLGGDHKGQPNDDEKLVNRGAAASEPRPRAALVHEGHRIRSSYVACFEMLDPKASIRDKFSDCAVTLETVCFGAAATPQRHAPLAQAVLFPQAMPI
jgi:hypothetical protein